MEGHALEKVQQSPPWHQDTPVPTVLDMIETLCVALRQEALSQEVWNDLPPSVPGEFQYQLCIVDSGRKEPLPVDGGVFDLPAAGGTVAIRPALPVFQALAFAVTREAPGGAVVSRNPHLVVLMR